MSTLAASGTTPAPEGISAPTATLYAAVIALMAGIAVSVLTNIFTNARERSAYRRDLTLQRLNELYGPLKMLLEQNKVLSDQLKNGKPHDWHILANISGVESNPTDKAIVDQILAIDEKIAEILESKSGLCLFPIPDSFPKFLGHYRMLSRAVAGQTFVHNNAFEYFPQQFEVDVMAKYDSLAEDLEKEGKKWFRRRR